MVDLRLVALITLLVARFVRLDDRGRILIAGEAYDENHMSRDDSA